MKLLKYAFIHRYLHVILAFVGLLWFGYLTFFWNGEDGGSDNFMHYRIARYAFKYPELFFNHWGKPLFVMFTAPFAQLGYWGIKLFNVLIALLTFWEVNYLLKRLEVKNGWLSFFFLFCAPAYYYMVSTCMTEVFFAFWVTTACVLALKNRIAASAILLGFVIWIRTEGFVFFLPFAVFYLFQRKWMAIPALGIGWLTLSLIGLPFKDGLLWFFTDMPYGDSTSIYGTGSFFHYLKEYDAIWGLAVGLAFLLGSVVLVGSTFKQGIWDKLNPSRSILLLAVGCSLAYFVAHSYSWYSGKGSSLGLTRVMAGIIPLMALASLYGIKQLPVLAAQSVKLAQPLMFAFALWALINWTVNAHVFFPENQIMEATGNATQHFKKTHFKGQKLHYVSPSFIHYMEVDPYDQSKSRQYFGMGDPSEIKEGEILVWDAHHSPSEGGLELETVMNNSRFELIAFYQPEFGFTVFRDLPFEMYFFQKTAPDSSRSNYAKKLALIEEFKQNRPSLMLLEIPEEISLSPESAFSPDLSTTLADIDLEGKLKIEVKVDVRVTTAESCANTHIVLAQTNGQTVEQYDSRTLGLIGMEPSADWQPITVELNTNSSAQTANLKCYVYVTNGAQVHIKNLRFRAVQRVVN